MYSEYRLTSERHRQVLSFHGFDTNINSSRRVNGYLLERVILAAPVEKVLVTQVL